MSYVIALTALFGALCVLNIMLTVGVLRRLREIEERTAYSGLDLTPGPLDVMLAVGEQVGEFTTVTTEGEHLSDAFLSDGHTVVGIFAHGCGKCDERLPEFVSFVRAHGISRERVLALMVGTPEQVEAKRALAEPVSTVVIEELDGPVSLALAARVYPALAVIGPDKVVRATGSLIRHVSSLVDA
ncbi:hypothetical protein [Streptomyces sp. LUP30]|uniref:TlpA family protein disulfide reductase n=1 Tax=Streptomyces sp. LUP30 TaxID=1890285 RepID=UPI000851848D|nr:hypothetical protein [Streptomyces sp. LUP30]